MAHRKTKKRHDFTVKHRTIPGAAPGELTANPLSHPTKLSVFAYSHEGCLERDCQSVEEIQKLTVEFPVVLLTVTGLGDIDIIEKIGNMFAIERLSLEDILDTSHSPKIEHYEHYIFTILKGISINEQIETEQFSLLLRKNVVIVFEEKPNPTNFSSVKERIRRGAGRIRSCGSDYLYYAIIDEIIDRYFPILDSLSSQLIKIEDDIMASGYYTSSEDIIRQIHNTKSDLMILHRTIWPVSDLISMLIREETQLLTKSTRIFLRDCHDHSKQANELTQFYRDTSSGLLNTFLAYEGHKTNEIFKILTMISAVFIPLNFIAGVYGMNFSHHDSPFNMPELRWYYGYPFALFLMMITALSMLFYFKKRGWVSYIPKE